MAIAIAVVHDDPRLSVNCLAHAYAFHRAIGLIDVFRKHLPLVGEVLGCCLEDAASGFGLVEQMIELVGLIIDDVAIDSGIARVEQPFWFSFKVGEVIVGILVIDLVEASIALQQRIEHHVFACLMVVDSFRSPHASHILPCLGVFGREVDSAVLPVDEVG